jgi:hypothetical protein
MRATWIVAVLVVMAGSAAANPDPKRKVSVLEYRASSAGLPGIAARVAAALGKQTSLGVLAPDQTRAIYGDNLEQALVKCAGEADCVAKIGKKVGAAEVILVGVSELGDVILTMQRSSRCSASMSPVAASAGASPIHSPRARRPRMASSIRT